MADLSEDQKKIVDLQTQVETLTKGKVADQKTIDGLTAQVGTLTKAKNDSDNQLIAAGQVVEDLKIQLAEKKAGTIELPTFSVNKDTYELVGGGFMYKGREVTLEVLQEDSKLAAELVKEGVGHLRKLAK